jgi:hypothetical protein
MSTRDTTPYLEHTDTLPDGTQLHAIQNLTEYQLQLIRGLLNSERTRLTSLLPDAQGTNTYGIVRNLLPTLDQLLLSLHFTRHT